jgi:hypothetical protein
MNASFFFSAVAFFIAASTLTCAARDDIDPWSPPGRLSPIFNSERIKERPTPSRGEEGHVRCSQGRFGEFSDWSEPVWLGPIVNSSADDEHPAISPNGLSLYISSTRPGGFGLEDIWVSQRDTVDDPWGPRQNLGPNINAVGNDFGPDLSPDGHWLFFSSTRPPGMLGASQIWVSYRKDVDDDFG